MKDQSVLVFQYKIHLDEITPTIWRRIQVPGIYSFWDLHVAIQDAMGWQDYHLHEFELLSLDTQSLVRIGIPDEDYEWSRDTLPGWKVALSDYFNEENQAAKYTYDFGDNWIHWITLEKIEPANPESGYPNCIGGERAFPPEDVGGTHGYESFLEIIRDPDHHDHQQMLEWVGIEFDPEHFDPHEVWFDDPAERWKFAFGNYLDV